MLDGETTALVEKPVITPAPGAADVSIVITISAKGPPEEAEALAQAVLAAAKVVIPGATLGA